MKREIKFRGLRTDNGGFAYGYVIVDEDGLTYIVNNIETSYVWDDVIPESVGQFTGLKDSKGVDIYEGDLLADPYPVDEYDLSKGYYKSFLPVVWCSSTLQWCVDASFEKDGGFLTSLVEYFGDELEVVGNIHESATELKEE